MMMNKPDIIFMGTPEFAVSSLKILIDNNYNIKAVVTAPDKPAGRGKKIRFSDVKSFALEHNLKILQPTNLKSDSFLEELENLNADLFIVVAFRMLPKEVWKMPKLGTFNLHASLLPDYRGAAPINHAIINGDKITGVTSFFINEEIDKGEIILSKETKISDIDNAGSLHDKLMIIGADLVLETVKLIEKGNVSIKAQNLFENVQQRPAPKIFKDDCKINWNRPVENIHNLIRGLSPYPAAWTCLNDKTNTSIKIFESEFIKEDHTDQYGKIITDNKNYIKVSATDGYVSLKEVQIQGKKRMKVKDLLNGYKLEENSFFE